MVLCLEDYGTKQRYSKHAMFNVRNSTAREHVWRRLSVHKIKAERKAKHYFFPVKLEVQDRLADTDGFPQHPVFFMSE